MSMCVADLLIGFYRTWHGRFRLRGAGALLKRVSPWVRGLQNYPLHVDGVGTVLLDMRDVGSFMWLNYALDGHQPEEALMAVLRAIARPGQVMWDIGANVGMVSALCCGAGFRFSRVETFEPNPALHGRLCFLFDASPLVRVHQVALGDREAVLPLNLKPGDSLRSSFVEPGSTSVPVPLMTGDALVQAGTAEAPDIIKIDTEGFEAQTIAGLSGVIKDRKPCLLLEESSDVDSIIEQGCLQGYRRLYITSDGHLTENAAHPNRSHNGALIPGHIDVTSLLV